MKIPSWPRLEKSNHRDRNRLNFWGTFALGAAFSGVLALGGYWGQGNSRKSPEPVKEPPLGETNHPAPWTTQPAQTSRASPPRSTEAIQAHGDMPKISGSAAQRLRELEERLAMHPEDLPAQKEIAVLLLNHHHPVRAFEAASAILQISPNDPDGLFVQGSVRLLMGQPREAIALLDRVLETYPNHLAAQLTRESASERLQQGFSNAGTPDPGRSKPTTQTPDKQYDELVNLFTSTSSDPSVASNSQP